ncbi:MAG: LolA-like protein [Thermoleophilia bacterium]
MNRRDEQLGAALRGLDVPEHAPDFFAKLEQELLSAELEDDHVPVGARGDAPTGARVGARVGAWAGASADASAPRRRGLRFSGRRPLSWGLAAAALAAVALIAVMLVPRTLLPDRVANDLGPGVATAAEVKAKVAAALERAAALRGVLMVISPDGADAAEGEMRWDFATTARGDILLRGSNVLDSGRRRTEELAYDAGTGVERAWSREGDDAPFGGERTGLAAGPPDPGPSEWVLQRNLGGVVRALLAADAPPDAGVTVSETTYEERPAWILSTAVEQNRVAGSTADHMEVTVDQETGFPVRVVETLKGELIREMRLERLEIDPVLPDGTFSIDFPEGLVVESLDQGFRRVDLTQATDVADYEPPLPAAVPDGFGLALITVAEQGMNTGKEGMNPPARGVVSASYRRGFDTLLVSSRLVGDDPSVWSDPLSGGEGFVERPERVTLEAGAFAGRVAEVLIDPRSQMPHLWVMDATLVVTVAGDLSRAELIAVAESLTPGGSAE